MRPREMMLLGLISFSAGCHQGPPHYTIAPASDPPYPTGDAVGVYRAVLRKLYLSSGESPPFVVLWDSTQFHSSDCWKLPCARMPAHHSEITRDMMRDYERATRVRAPMRGDFGFELPIVLFSEGDRNEIERIGKPLSDSVLKVNRSTEAMPFWLGFRKRYPGAWGYVVLTRVGFDPARQHAIVQVAHRCGSGCGHLEEMFLEKNAEEWQVAERMLDGPRGQDYVDVLQRFYPVVWDGRDSVVLGSLRYLGPDAHYLANYRREKDSLRAWIRDSVAGDKLPRRIRGTITYKRTGLPLAFVELVAHVAPNNRIVRVVSDSLGRYEIKDSPIGGTMLEVKCPGAGGAQGKTLDAPGLYAHAAIDTVINRAIPDIAPCWDRYRAHRLQPGWLESAEARSASYPTPEAAAVYESVLRLLDRASRQKGRVFVLADSTRERCVESDDCGTPQLNLLLAEHRVDSSAVRDFLRESRSGATLRPTEQYGVKTIFLTRAERDFLRQEGDPLHQSNRDADTFWNAFGQAFPNSDGVVSFTRVGFNPSHTQALVEVNLENPAREGPPTEMILLERNAGKWKAALRNINRRITIGTFRAGRCVPALAPARSIDASLARSLAGDFAITEVATTRDDRVFRSGIRLPEANRRSKQPAEDPRAAAVLDSTGERIPRLLLDWSVKDGHAAIDIWDGNLDGYFEKLVILRISGDTFFGNWSSSLGMTRDVDRAGKMMPNPNGYFCAQRIRNRR